MNKRKAIVTGALGGMGTAIVSRLLANNYFVVGTFRPGAESRAEDWRERHFAGERSLKIVALDVSCAEMSEQVCSDLISELGIISVLINNAGITDDSSFRKMTYKQWHSVLETNLGGCFNMCKAIFLHMSEQKYGRIINISSVNGQKGQFGQANYAASKAGIYGLTKSLALEGARKGITCNSISPGYIRTDMTKQIPDHVLEPILGTIPVGRMGEPEEIANAVLFLADELSGFITGANLSVNGGQHM
ncbi:acetoacetyl-CoA reductase [Pseudidiomarina sp. 1APP75-32.1]|uniref:Acetoacetyl-CoA reductase n=1 Tax=Pseudidiomarina terrestris TaxID=2820060 RepID=A0AAW7R1J9_9GAMM|nr:MULTISPECIES: acetoacetyl-CoA reductase [unclassified Pseudidiomarina]MDN7124510.1 acetoacetyl-CoA reductase [Pseudidiomarina sp. 1APP75-32.1]MDN7129199.1 acetoacetyl-CoA reductase [Pseudidiomarina sp. 1APR75-15]